MPDLRILMSNIGYARGLSGSLSHHLLLAHRHFYCSPAVQQNVLDELKKLILKEKPDLCCLVEIERGALASGYFNQLYHLLDERYRFHDIANKYAEKGGLMSLPIMESKCNAFFSNRPFGFEKLYLAAGWKRLVYKIALRPHLTLFFSHFSLRRSLRARQFLELRKILDHTPGEHILMGDFNILTGLEELHPLMEGTDLALLNNPGEMTFRFHRQHRLLDLCICPEKMRDKVQLRVLPQPYSDHAALLLHLHGIGPDPREG